MHTSIKIRWNARLMTKLYKGLNWKKPEVLNTCIKLNEVQGLILECGRKIPNKLDVAQHHKCTAS